MGMLVISGPEKAGKSTLIAALANEIPEVAIRHWEGPATDQRNTRFLQALKTDYAVEGAGSFIIWDRSWLCHQVYGLLLQSKLNETILNPLLSDWLYGRAVDTLGAKFVLLPEDWRESANRRDETDLAIHPRFEYAQYKLLAEMLGWHILYNDYTVSRLRENVAKVLSLIEGKRPHRLEDLVTPPNAKVIFVAEKNMKEAPNASMGEWLPFSSKEGITLAGMIGPKSLECGWAYCHMLPPQYLRKAPVLVTLGELPYIWCKNYVGHKRILALPKLPHLISGKYAQEWENTTKSLLLSYMAMTVDTTETKDTQKEIATNV